MSIKIIADKDSFCTKVYTEDGAEIKNISSIEIGKIEANTILSAKIEVMVGHLEISNVDGEIVGKCIGSEKPLKEGKE